ncbi:hypothetical protein HJFPF1_06360 [Paramyrothecium foliicola]|nr:hypothetical protein HJFPF1_06360 [Paramyrothecium foliicola]
MLAATITAAAFGLLAWPVEAGSRHWEGSSPLAARSTNGTMEVFRRAISFQPSGGESGHYTWPDKKIKYCYADPTAKQKLRGSLEEAMQTTWGALRDLGFSYEEVDLAKCDKDRINHLKVHYNDKGMFSTSVGKQPVDEKWNRENPDNQVHGPSMHLSTKEDVGMLDVVANVAHELGHAWGLYHEHQNPNFWATDFDDQFPSGPNDAPWSQYNGNDVRFRPNQFNCRALSDYDEALQRAQELAAGGGEYADIARTFCSIQAHASKVKFSAKDWLPLSHGVPVIADATFDPRSIMLYPSGAGGNRGANTADGRQNVLTLAGGAQMTPNVVPSGQDVERLRVLYSTNIANIQELHIRGAKKSTFDKIKKKMPKFGSAKDKTC